MADEKQDEADEIRLETVLGMIKDAIWRFEDTCEGRRSVYDVVGCLVEDLIAEGICPACIHETVGAVFEAVGADTSKHKDADSVYH